MCQKHSNIMQSILTSATVCYCFIVECMDQTKNGTMIATGLQKCQLYIVCMKHYFMIDT